MKAFDARKSKPAPPPPYEWIASSEAFIRMIDRLRGSDRIALDIEADSLYHYFEKVCLIQISTRDHTFIIDPLSLHDLSALGPIVTEPAIEKVLHASAYDLSCLRRDYRFSVRNIFDTHLAAQLCGYEQLGLCALLEKLLGISHSKRRQRDDWSRRPLDREQLEYAAMDTHFLLDLRDLLEKELEHKDRLDWAREEFQVAAAFDPPEREFDPEGYRKIKGSQDLSPQAQAVLKSLYLLRDRFAREMDLPPFKVLNNSILIDLARRPPSSPRSLFARPGVSGRLARTFGDEIFRCIRSSRAEDPSSAAPRPRSTWKPPTRETKLRIERLKSWRREKSKQLGLHVGIVFPGNLLEMLAAEPPMDQERLENVPGMRRWRASAFGPEILQALGAE